VVAVVVEADAKAMAQTTEKDISEQVALVVLVALDR
jgi:hypothetical protein